MKLHTTGFFTILAILGAITAISSCSKTDYIAGLWQGTPQRIAQVPGASEASSTMSIDFAPRSDKHGAGEVLLNLVIEVQQAVVGSPVDGNAPYQANVTASASISGTYVPEEGGDDDYMLSLDESTLKVTVDPAGVVFANNLLTDMERPVLDSLTVATADQWRVILTSVAREQFYRYAKIKDVKIHHGDMMSMEVEDRDHTFRRVAQN